MKVIAINGTSNSGKTATAEAVISELRRRGYTVGSVKEIHDPDFALDPDPGKDTGRHRAASSQLITARGPYETDILYRLRLPIDDILAHYDHDFVILEGVGDCNAPRIITAHTVEEVEERIDGRAVAVAGVLANTLMGELFGLPIFNALKDPGALAAFVEKRAFAPLPSFDPDCCSACGYSCREFAELVAQQKAGREDCLLDSSETELLINGKPIAMVPFVQKLLRNAVMGVVQELRGFKKGSKIELSIK